MIILRIVLMGVKIYSSRTSRHQLGKPQFVKLILLHPSNSCSHRHVDPPLGLVNPRRRSRFSPQLGYRQRDCPETRCFPREKVSDLASSALGPCMLMISRRSQPSTTWSSSNDSPFPRFGDLQQFPPLLPRIPLSLPRSRSEELDRIGSAQEVSHLARLDYSLGLRKFGPFQLSYPHR